MHRLDFPRKALSSKMTKNSTIQSRMRHKFLVFALSLCGAVVVLYVGIFLAYVKLEHAELKQQLVDASETHDGLSEGEEISSTGRTGDVLILPADTPKEFETAGQDDRFYERTFSDKEFLVYRGDSGQLYAITDDRAEQQLFYFGLTLALVFLAQLIFMFAWWSYFKHELEHLTHS